ncbi:hypothetical protein [Marinobacter salicampi]|uniref:hypothetical protein n=1 Tax=Marinobacter salicampi TaxID=435907 RepID=UPI00140E8FCA|nr:hypothetical protein [Marinobacter salicampi]
MSCVDLTNPYHFELLADWCEEAVLKHLAYGTDPDEVHAQVNRVIRYVESKLNNPDVTFAFNREEILHHAHAGWMFFFQAPEFQHSSCSISEVQLTRHSAFPNIHDEWDVYLVERESRREVE